MLVALAVLGCKPTPPPIEIIERDRPSCAQPNARVSAEFPFEMFELTDTTKASETYVWGGGIAAEDFDGDGAHELVTARDGVIEYLDWTGSDWVERPLPDLDMAYGFGATAVDLDADGDADLVITRWGRPNHVLENDGGDFSIATARFGLAGPDDHHSSASSFADIDGDGDLDALIAGHGFVDEANPDPTQFAPADDTLLFENTGDGTFVDIRDRIPASAHGRYTFIGGFTDFDVDGDPDLLMINDFGRRYRSGQLLWNDGTGRYTEDGNAAGLDLAVAGMGLGVAELNGDGVPDVIVPYWAGYAVMVSTGAFWADFSVASGLTPNTNGNQTVGWGAMFGDVDNDSWEDAVVMHGWIETDISNSEPVQPDALFRRTDLTAWDNVSQQWNPLDTGDNRGLVVADFDGDGWLDYARPDLTGPTRVYMARCGNEAFLNVVLSQPGPNPHAVGAIIEAVTPERTIWRQVSAGGVGYGSSKPFEQHLGFADLEVVDLKITWPDGSQDRLDGVETRRRIEIRKN